MKSELCKIIIHTEPSPKSQADIHIEGKTNTILNQFQIVTLL